MAVELRLSVLGLREAAARVSVAVRTVGVAVDQEFNRRGGILDHAVQRMVVNTPIETGLLRANFLKVPARNGVGGIENLSAYAFEVHENPHGKRYGQGPISRQQPPQPEGGVGPKFMSRVVDAHARQWETQLRDAVRAALVRAGGG